jgi:hypothetical protein
MSMLGLFTAARSCHESKAAESPFRQQLDDDLLVAFFELFTFGLEHLQLERGLALSFYEDLARD